MRITPKDIDEITRFIIEGAREEQKRFLEQKKQREAALVYSNLSESKGFTIDGLAEKLEISKENVEYVLDELVSEGRAVSYNRSHMRKFKAVPPHKTYFCRKILSEPLRAKKSKLVILTDSIKQTIEESGVIHKILDRLDDSGIISPSEYEITVRDSQSCGLDNLSEKEYSFDLMQVLIFCRKNRVGNLVNNALLIYCSKGQEEFNKQINTLTKENAERKYLGALGSYLSKKKDIKKSFNNGLLNEVLMNVPFRY